MKLFYSPTSPYVRKVMVLLHETGQLDDVALYDSRVICAYLDDRAGAGLYPQGTSRWDTLTLEATADGMLDAALAMVYEGKLRPEDKRMSEWVEGQWGKVDRACKTLNNQWAAHLAGPLDMGQIALGCALGYIDFRHAARDWRAGNPDLAAWFDAFDSRPAMTHTAPPQ